MHRFGTIVVVLFLAACKRSTSDPPPNDAVPNDPTVQVASSDGEAPHPVTTGVVIHTETVMDSAPFEHRPKQMMLAIFPADPNAPAIEMFESPGEYRTTLAAGHYELCAGGTVAPTCVERTGTTERRVRKCPEEGSTSCTCTPPNAQRSGWTKGCKRFDVTAGSLTKITAADGYFPGTSYTCASPDASVCH